MTHTEVKPSEIHKLYHLSHGIKQRGMIQLHSPKNFETNELAGTHPDHEGKVWKGKSHDDAVCEQCHVHNDDNTPRKRGCLLTACGTLHATDHESGLCTLV
jgi:hypothetical protein